MEKTRLTDSSQNNAEIDYVKPKTHYDYKAERVEELVTQVKKLLESEEYEKAILRLKKLAFFEPDSKYLH
jgi:hypothetical protein